MSSKVSRLFLRGARGVRGDYRFCPDGLSLEIRVPKHEQEVTKTQELDEDDSVKAGDAPEALESRGIVRKKRPGKIRFDLHSLVFPVHPVHLAAMISMVLSGSGGSWAWLGRDGDEQAARFSFYRNSRPDSNGQSLLAFMTFHRVTEKRPLGTFPLSIMELVQLYMATSAMAGEIHADAFGSLLVVRDNGEILIRCGGGPGTSVDHDRRCELRDALVRMAGGVKVRFFRPGLSVFVDDEGKRWMAAGGVRTRLDERAVHRLLVHLGS
jgi:hypothetical protein